MGALRIRARDRSQGTRPIASGGRGEEREAARRQLVVRRRFTRLVIGYVTISGVLNAVWTFTGTGLFWVTAPLSGLAAALVLHAWDIYPRRPITVADVEAELDHEHDRLRASRTVPETGSRQDLRLDT